MDQAISNQYKAYANNIVGTWHNELPNEVMIFSFLYDYTQQSDLLIIEKGIRTEKTYSIQNTESSEWLLIIWDEENNKAAFYSIDLLSADKLVLKSNRRELKTYLRKVDTAFADSILNKAQ